MKFERVLMIGSSVGVVYVANIIWMDGWMDGWKDLFIDNRTNMQNAITKIRIQIKEKKTLFNWLSITKTLLHVLKLFHNPL